MSFMRLLLALLALSLSNHTANAWQVNAPTVHVAAGTLVGMVHGRISIFEGIPFAAPPIGNLRWREPQPVASWQGIRQAIHPGSPCTQPAAGLDAFLAPLAEAYGKALERAPVQSSEDCLYLNIFTPGLNGLPASSGWPVMVWLHGGSNRVGTGADEGYDGSSLAAHGVIVVTLNYRLGVMGFFSHPELTAESPHHSSGNYGLLDQLAALQWVRQNIRQFGGDPGSVTVFGESAGSVDAATLMTSPLAKDLFRRVIAESGPAFGLGPALLLVDAQTVGTAVGQAALRQFPARTRALDALRQMSAAQVVDLDARVVAASYRNFDPNGSVVDGWLLPQPPATAFASGNIQKVDLLAGLNGRELSAFRMGAAAAAKQAAKSSPKDTTAAALKKLAEAAHPLYGGWTDMALGLYLAQILAHGDRAVDKASNDMLVACPVGAEVALVTNVGARAYLYRFDRSIPGQGEPALGAFHGLEVPFVFNAFAARSWRWLPFTPIDRTLSAVVESYWTNFAKSGDPNAPGLASWKVWNSEQEPYLDFSPDGVALPQTSFSPPFCHLAPRRLQESLNIH